MPQITTLDIKVTMELISKGIPLPEEDQGGADPEKNFDLLSNETLDASAIVVGNE